LIHQHIAKVSSISWKYLSYLQIWIFWREKLKKEDHQSLQIWLQPVKMFPRPSHFYLLRISVEYFKSRLANKQNNGLGWLVTMLQMLASMLQILS